MIRLAPPRRPRHARFGLPASALLHLVVIAALLIHFRNQPTLPDAPEHLATVDVVVGGGGHHPAPPAPQPATPPSAKPAFAEASSTEAASTASGPPLPQPPPLPPAPPRPMPMPPPTPPPPPPVRLGDASLGPAGQIKANKNNRIRPAKGAQGNMPPRYPIDAALRRERGTVHVKIHVDASGHVSGIDFLPPLTFSSLNKAVRQVVMTWHFTPAESDGKPVPSVFPLDFVFE